VPRDPSSIGALYLTERGQTILPFISRDIRLLAPEPVKGAGNFLCNFMSPIYSRGLTVEFVRPFHPRTNFGLVPAFRVWDFHEPAT
jgi:hypothetical protein